MGALIGILGGIIAGVVLITVGISCVLAKKIMNKPDSSRYKPFSQVESH